jgi:DNA-binding protein HU-beta
LINKDKQRQPHWRALSLAGYRVSIKIAGFRPFHLKGAEFRETVRPGKAGKPRFVRPSTGKDVWMNKNDLIAVVADTTGMSRANAGQAVDATFDAITNALKQGDEVKVIGFGNFTVAQRAASTGRNPRTGEAIAIAASKSPKFRAGKGLKDAVNR